MVREEITSEAEQLTQYCGQNTDGAQASHACLMLETRKNHQG